MLDTNPEPTLYRTLSGRRSIRRYRPDDVRQDVLQRLLAAATTAPSSHNRQPWRFLVIRDAGTKLALATAMGRRLREDRSRDGDDPAAIELDVQRSRARITGAPVVLAVCLTIEEMDVYPDAARNRAEYLMAVQSTAMAVQNLMLAAHAEGLGTCWMCAPLFCPDVVRTALGLPLPWEPQALVTLGHPDGPGRARARRPLSEIVRESSISANS
ncbi:MAG TPA: nitroreductase family protein [Candidatus Cybelea sp.]|nr:nitroreductase family protein [Candidatus Cybelea sp.]